MTSPAVLARVLADKTTLVGAPKVLQDPFLCLEVHLSRQLYGPAQLGHQDQKGDLACGALIAYTVVP